VSADEIPGVFEPEGSCLYHYTRLDTALEYILPNWQLRMSPFSRMRDPRESQLLGLEGVMGWPPDESTEREMIESFGELSRRAHDVKNRVKVLALTRDDPVGRDETSAVFGRGFAHPRLWEHYADEHRGVCLCLDLRNLVDMARHSVRHHGELTDAPVRYVDAELAPQARSIILADIHKDAPQETLDEHLRTHLHELFFTKLKDWESEMEYRLVLPSDHDLPVYVGIRNALRALVLGERVSDAYLPSLAKPCDEQTVQIFKIRWPYGRPRLEPKTLAAG
jgi:Protein of unknown function (DUF2971)